MAILTEWRKYLVRHGKDDFRGFHRRYPTLSTLILIIDITIIIINWPRCLQLACNASPSIRIPNRVLLGLAIFCFSAGCLYLFYSRSRITRLAIHVWCKPYLSGIRDTLRDISTYRLLPKASIHVLPVASVGPQNRRVGPQGQYTLLEVLRNENHGTVFSAIDDLRPNIKLEAKQYDFRGIDPKVRKYRKINLAKRKERASKLGFMESFKAKGKIYVIGLANETGLLSDDLSLRRDTGRGLEGEQGAPSLLPRAPKSKESPIAEKKDQKNMETYTKPHDNGDVLKETERPDANHEGGRNVSQGPKERSGSEIEEDIRYDAQKGNQKQRKVRLEEDIDRENGQRPEEVMGDGGTKEKRETKKVTDMDNNIKNVKISLQETTSLPQEVWKRFKKDPSNIKRIILTMKSLKVSQEEIKENWIYFFQKSKQESDNKKILAIEAFEKTIKELERVQSWDRTLGILSTLGST